MTKRQKTKLMFIMCVTLLVLALSINYIHAVTAYRNIVQDYKERVAYAISAEPTIRKCMLLRNPFVCTPVYRKLFAALDGAPSVYVELVYAYEELLDFIATIDDPDMWFYSVTKMGIDDPSFRYVRYIKKDKLAREQVETYLLNQLGTKLRNAVKYVH